MEIENTPAPANDAFGVPFMLGALQNTVATLKAGLATATAAASVQTAETGARFDAIDARLDVLAAVSRLLAKALNKQLVWAEDPDTGEMRPVLEDIPTPDKSGKAGAGGSGKGGPAPGGQSVADPTDAVPGRTGAFDFARRPAGRRRLI